ncbi:hypothetical protein C4D60_Mb02t12330 [Musa balbisiana]|uniref:Uncharacterized protein n=1 Tax=Musa balbisiana TaxID=52838 RepID=A0A4S8IA49_MUSBA|nr:hypothetical protein C4D60_Mb02t12330 [Musa balbisiana]
MWAVDLYAPGGTSRLGWIPVVRRQLVQSRAVPEQIGGTSPASSSSIRVGQMSGRVSRRLPTSDPGLMLEYSLLIWEDKVENTVPEN